MNAIVPWAEIVLVVDPFYPNSKNHPKGGRPAYNLETMLRIYFLQKWFGDLSDPSMEEALYDSSSFFEFAKIDQQRSIPDETTICKFRYLLEKHQLNERFFEKVNHILEEKKLLLRRGTIVDATIISAPCSTKNAERKRDPEMSSTKKRKPPASRHEIAYWTGCSIRFNSFIGLHIGECARYDRYQSMITRHGRGCFCGFRLYRN